METRRIPLFPLNLVLFPGMPLPLHVFEPRYREMVRQCLAGDRTFGVCLIRSGEEVGGPADPYSVGVTCEILAVERLDGGRINLVTVGRSRFRVDRLLSERAFLEAEVTLLSENAEAPEELAERVRSLTRTYLRSLFRLAGETERTLDLPAEPGALSWTVGALLQVPLPVRQELLECSTTALRLEYEAALLEAELQRHRALGDQPSRARPFRADRKGLILN